MCVCECVQLREFLFVPERGEKVKKEKEEKSQDEEVKRKVCRPKLFIHI